MYLTKKTGQTLGPTLGLMATLENQAVNELRYPHRVASVSEFENSSSVEMCLDDKDSGDLLDGNWGLEDLYCCFKISEILYRAHFLAHEVLLPPYLHISLRISCASVNICFQHYIFTDPILGFKFSNGRFSISQLHSCSYSCSIDAVIIIATINLNEYILLVIPVILVVLAVVHVNMLWRSG